jgi:hypothetical protein
MKIVLILLVQLSLFAGTLRILNIPKYSTIKIDDTIYHNATQRSLEVPLKSSFVSYDVVVSNQYFFPEKFSVKIDDKQVAIHTLHMKYAHTFYTNIFVKDKYGQLDHCDKFKCQVDAGEKITSNLYQYKDNMPLTYANIKVTRNGYYDETEIFNIKKNQKIIITPVDAWSEVSFSLIVGIYSDTDGVFLNYQDRYVKYKVDGTTMYGVGFSYRKNTPFNFYLTYGLDFLGASETHETDDDLTDGLNDNGTPSVDYATFKAGAGIKFGKIYLEGGMKYVNTTIEKTYTDGTYSFEETKTVPYGSINLGWFGLGITDNVTTISIRATF